MIKVEYRFERIGWAIYIYRGNSEYREMQQADGTWKQVKEGAAVVPTLFIEDIQELANAIAEAGIKPPSDHKLEGVMQAQKQHLEDMRKLVFEPTISIDKHITLNTSEPWVDKGKDDVTT